MIDISNNVDLTVNVFNDISNEDLNRIIKAYKNYPVGFNDFDILGSGAQGTVYGYKNYAIKYIDDIYDSGNNDADVLRDLHHLDFIPKLYAVINEEIIVCEKIIGMTVNDYCRYDDDNSLNINLEFIEEFEHALYEIIKSGYCPIDMHSGNVMVCTDSLSPKIVDVGHFRKHSKDYSNKEFDVDFLNGVEGFKSAGQWTTSQIKRYIGMHEYKKYNRKKGEELNVG